MNKLLLKSWLTRCSPPLVPAVVLHRQGIGSSGRRFRATCVVWCRRKSQSLERRTRQNHLGSGCRKDDRKRRLPTARISGERCKTERIINTPPTKEANAVPAESGSTCSSIDCTDAVVQGACRPPSVPDLWTASQLGGEAAVREEWEFPKRPPFACSETCPTCKRGGDVLNLAFNSWSGGGIEYFAPRRNGRRSSTVAQSSKRFVVLDMETMQFLPH